MRKHKPFTSNAATLASIDINKVKELWGESIFNLTYQLTEVKLERQYTTLSVGPFGALIRLDGRRNVPSDGDGGRLRI